MKDHKQIENKFLRSQYRSCQNMCIKTKTKNFLRLKTKDGLKRVTSKAHIEFTFYNCIRECILKKNNISNKTNSISYNILIP